MPRGKQKGIEKYTLRLYDGFDNKWMDILKEVSYEEAYSKWLDETNGGTERTSYSDIDYYDIFPSNTRMLFDGSNSL